jgi:hypothetical protein
LGGRKRRSTKISIRIITAPKSNFSEEPCGKQKQAKHLIHREFLSFCRAVTLSSLFETARSANLSTKAQSPILPGQSGRIAHAELAILHYLCNPHPQNKENKMNVNQLREQLTKLSIDELVVQLDRFSAEPTVESRIVEAVLAQKISALTKELPFPKEEEAPELDGRTCPPAINSPSTASFESVTPRGDSNSVAAHVEMFGPELKPSPAPNRERRWAPDHVPAVPSADVVGASPIHADGTQSNTFVGDVPTLPGVKISFNNPGRSA